MHRRVLILLVCAIALMSFGGAQAEVPKLLNFQAILLDSLDGPVPDGVYELTFRVMPDSVGGVPLWEETQNVATDNGLFNTFLGLSTPIDDNIFNDDERWLELQLTENPDPYEPRSQIGSVAYAMRVNSVDGATGGTITGNLRLNSTFFAEQVDVGDPGRDGLLNLFQTGTNDPILTAGNNSIGSSVRTYDAAGNPVAHLDTDADGVGGFLSLYRNDTDAGFTVDANYHGAQEPAVMITGSTQNAVFDMSETGDPSVSLPADALSAPEILDETGISQGIMSGDVEVTGAGSMIDIVTCSITIPAAGYITVEASAQARLFSISLYSANYMICQIDETAGGAENTDYSYRVGVASVPNIETSWWPVAMRRTYYKAAPGTYEFRFEAMDGSNQGSKIMWNPVITATYVSTSYGTVEALVSAYESQTYQSLQIENAIGDNVREATGTRSAYKVDLSELEDEVLQRRVALLNAQRELIDAEIKLQEAQATNGGGQ